MKNNFKHSWRRHYKGTDKEQIKYSYRGHEVMNQFANKMFGVVVAVAYILAACVVITCLFCLIRFTSSLPILFLLWILAAFVVVSGILVLLITKAVQIRVLSKSSFTSFQRFDLNQNRETRLFWKSCRPLRINVGSFGSIESHEFLLILFGDIVLNNTVTLLLSTR